MKILSIIALIIMLLFPACVHKHYYYHPKMLLLRQDTTYQEYLEVCRIDSDGTMICEYDLEFFGDDDEFYCFPKSEYER